jgi:hypothetical protein
MGWIEDFQNLLQGVPLSAVLRERIALAEQKYEATLRENEQLKQKVEFLERENAELRAQIPQAQEEIVLSDDDSTCWCIFFKLKIQSSIRWLQPPHALFPSNLFDLRALVADLQTFVLLPLRKRKGAMAMDRSFSV